MISRAVYKCLGSIVFVASLSVAPATADEAAWEKVQDILASTSSVVILDGTESVAQRADETDAPAYGGRLVRHITTDPPPLNPYTRSTTISWFITHLIFEPLLYAEKEPPHRLRGWLAKEYPQVSADKLSYRFELRPEARFSDGRPVTAQDVLFSAKALVNPQVMAAASRSFVLSDLQDVKVHGEHGIEFVFTEPFFLKDVNLGRFFFVLPKHFYDPENLLDPVPLHSLVDGSWAQGEHAERVERFAEQFNQNFNRRTLGSGSYVIENPERDIATQQKVVLTRNAGYWGRDVEGLPPAGYVDQIVFKVITNSDAAFIELTNGNLDYRGLQPLEFKEKSNTANFNAQHLKAVFVLDGFQFIVWNNDHPIFGDVRVRRAMTLMTDRQTMIEHLLFGLGHPVVGPISKFRPEYNADLIPHPYDSDRALDLLEEAGWDRDDDGILDKMIDGERVNFEFEIILIAGAPLFKDVALTLQTELQDFGIACSLRELDASILIPWLHEGNFDATVIGLVWGQPTSPPDVHMLLHSSQIGGKGLNGMGFRNAEADSLLETYRREFDVDKRIALYYHLQEILYEQQPMTFLWQPRRVIAFSRRFRGARWHLEGADLREWWLPADEQSRQ